MTSPNHKCNKEVLHPIDVLNEDIFKFIELIVAKYHVEIQNAVDEEKAASETFESLNLIGLGKWQDTETNRWFSVEFNIKFNEIN